MVRLHEFKGQLCGGHRLKIQMGLYFILCCGQFLHAQELAHLKLNSPFASYVSDDRFFSQTVDARNLGGGWPTDNVTPRGIILDVGAGIWVCFDPDLLRIALVWRENSVGEFLTMNSMSAGSYRQPYRKAPPGQRALPKPLGKPLLANGIYPGWSVGSTSTKLIDIRERGDADENEVGLGPLPVSHGEWLGLEDIGTHTVLKYKVDNAEISEWIDVSDNKQGIVRNFKIRPHDQPLTVINGVSGPGESVVFHRIPPSTAETTWRLTYANELQRVEQHPLKPVAHPLVIVETTVKRSPKTSGYVHDEVLLPVPNAMKRNVRLSGFDFFSDGRAAFCTFDGDVWLVDGLSDESQVASWQLFATGLHEPIGLEVSGDQVYVFGRNGIVRLHDRNDDGRVDYYENFCSLIAQTAETREFAMDILEKPGGGFYIAKGGQVAGTRGKYNGTIIEVAADGKDFKVIATGLRQPYLGVDPVSGLLTASDQQGNWRPATPIYTVEQGKYYGFQPAKFKDQAIHPAETSAPAIWIPHFVNQSGASQFWMRGAKVAGLEDALLHLGYFRPELLRLYVDKTGPVSQGAAVSVLSGFETGLLKGRVNPVDGSVFVTGFQIWGSVGGKISGLYRLRHAGGPLSVPADVRSAKRGVLLRFNEPLSAEIAADRSNYTVDRWNYRQTHEYGSGIYRLDGQPGQETVPVAQVYLSEDEKAIFLAIPDMQPVHSMRVSYRSALLFEPPTVQHAYLTVHTLNPVDLKAEGFGALIPDMKIVDAVGVAGNVPEPTVKLGKELYQLFGCVGCHSVDGSKVKGQTTLVQVGPTWKGLWGSRRDLSDGTSIRKVDAAYLRESIVDPGARVPKGFNMTETGVGMPSYLGVLKDHQIDSLILYIKSL